jgi:hypothetical protein
MAAAWLLPLNVAQESFDGENMRAHMATNWEFPVRVAVLYGVFLFSGQAYMRKQEPFALRKRFVLWNGLLAVASLIAAVHAVAVFVPLLLLRGTGYTLCDGDDRHLQNGALGFWTWVFVVSKVLELVDTAFLIFQKKPIVFLHAYFHCTMMLFCWYAYVRGMPWGIWLAVTDFVADTAVYTYFFCVEYAEATKSVARRFAHVVTALQLWQMTVGVLAATGALVTSYRQVCHADPRCAGIGVLLYASYVFLFGNFFWRAYLARGCGDRNEQSEPHVHQRIKSR